MAFKIKLTESIVANFPENEKTLNDSEIAGFFAKRLSESSDGKRKIAFYLRYRVGGRDGIQRTYKICNFGDMPFKQLRKLAESLRGRIAAGEDIMDERKKSQQSASEKEKETRFKEPLDLFKVYISSERKRPEIAIASIENDIEKQVGNVRISELSRKVLTSKVLEPIRKRKAHVQANKTLSLLKQILDFCIDKGYIEVNPLAGVRRKNVGGEEIPRTRVLTTDELKSVFSSLPSSGLSKQVQFTLRLLLLTGCRVNEVCLAKWNHIDLDNDVWTIPPENVKSKKGKEKCHTIPLNNLLKQTLLELKSEFALINSPYILPSTLTKSEIGSIPIDKRSVARAVNRKIQFFDIEPFTPHDLRRTFQTQIASIGVDTVVIEKLLNHELTGMLKVYNQYDYFKERKSALKKWEKTLNKKVFN